MENIGDRVRKLIDSKGVSAYEVSMDTGISQATLSRILNKNAIPIRGNRKKLADYFHVTESFLITGKDEYVNPSIDGFTINEPTEQIPNKNGNIFEDIGDGKYKIYVKKVPVKAFGSYLSHFQDSEFRDELKQVSFTVDHIGRGNYICFEVEGNSMDGGSINDAPAGAELLCRELGRQHWKDGFRDSIYGWVVVHKETVLYKDIKEFNIETGDIVCSSRSGLPQHPDFTVNLNDVNQIWKVIKRSY